MPPEASFQRDLGYLARFLDALRAHAAGLEPAAGERLLALLADQDDRWRDIAALLGATDPEPDAAEFPPPAEPAPAPAASSPPTAGRPAGLTVGSLVGD